MSGEPAGSGLLGRYDAHDLHMLCMLVLTCSTGISDAVGYLGLDRVFTGNMTGNVVILGMGLAGSDGLPVLGPLLALAAFMAGAAVAGRVLRPATTAWPRHITLVLLGVAAAFTVAGIGLCVLDRAVALHPVTVILAAASGMQAVAARNVAIKDVTTVVVTSTIVGLAADSSLGGAKQHPWARRAGAIIAIGAGAFLGALLMQIHIAIAVFLSAALTLIVAVIGRQGRR